MKTPEWLLKTHTTAALQNTSPTSGQGKKGFVEKTLEDISSFFEDDLFGDEYTKKNGLLQRIDPRVKLLTLLAMVVAVSVSTNTEVIIGVYLLTLILASASKIELKPFITRVWMFIPLFAGIIVLPSMFTPISTGTPIISLFEIGGVQIALTAEGISGAVLFISRVATSVSIVALLTLTTRWNLILKSLRVFKIPLIFVMVLEMTYRYIFLLIKTVKEMHLARRSRTIKKHGLEKGRNWVAGRIGYLFRKSYDLSQKVHFAMLSRGYTGEAKTLSQPKINRVDYGWSILSLAIIGIVLLKG